jgi:soluble epoxide hydrolase/lipid-phosphate phosphatase
MASTAAQWPHAFMRTAEGVTLHYVDVGPRDALPIVLVHGWPDLWFGWRVGLRSGVVVALHPLLVV